MTSARSRKSLVVAGSLLAHAGVIAALVVADLYRVEKLPIQASAPPMAFISGAGGARAGAAASSGLTRPERRLVRDVVQPIHERRHDAHAAAEVTVSVAAPGDVPGGGGDGGGETGGDGGGGAGDGPGGDGLCLDPGGCKLAPLPRLEPPQLAIEVPPPTPKVVPIAVLSALRVAGDPQIQPSDADARAMRQAGAAQVRGSFRFCIDVAGVVGDVRMQRGTGYADYDARLAAGIRAWRYRPLRLDGAATAACSTVVFVFTPR
jgi:hypothetical protein